jgi:hypothetical protein
VIVVWILLGVVALVAIAGVISYNRFVTQKNLIKDAWANIDTELRRRYDLIPNLVETVKGYATHEREVFEEVTRARASAAGATGSPAAQAAAEGPFMAALGKLFAVAEAYPDLKANQNFLALQAELSTRKTASRRRVASTTLTSASSTRGCRRSPRRSSPACSTSNPRSSSRSRTRYVRPERRRSTSRRRAPIRSSRRLLRRRRLRSPPRRRHPLPRRPQRLRPRRRPLLASAQSASKGAPGVP